MELAGVSAAPLVDKCYKDEKCAVSLQHVLTDIAVYGAIVGAEALVSKGISKFIFNSLHNSAPVAAPTLILTQLPKSTVAPMETIQKYVSLPNGGSSWYTLSRLPSGQLMVETHYIQAKYKNKVIPYGNDANIVGTLAARNKKIHDDVRKLGAQDYLYRTTFANAKLRDIYMRKRNATHVGTEKRFMNKIEEYMPVDYFIIQLPKLLIATTLLQQSHAVHLLECETTFQHLTLHDFTQVDHSFFDMPLTVTNKTPSQQVCENFDKQQVACSLPPPPPPPQSLQARVIDKPVIQNTIHTQVITQETGRKEAPGNIYRGPTGKIYTLWDGQEMEVTGTPPANLFIPSWKEYFNQCRYHNTSVNPGCFFCEAFRGGPTFR